MTDMYSSHHALRYFNGTAWLMLAVLIHNPSTSIAQQDRSLNSNNNLQVPATATILLPVSVTDERSNHVLGLKKNNFTVFVNGKPQETVFFSDIDKPTSICILFDVSGSMTGLGTEQIKRLRVANQVPARLVAQSHNSNEYFLITFNERPSLLLNGVSKDEVLTEMSKSPVPTLKGNTAIYDALSFGIQKLAGAAHSKRAILLITDGGGDNASQTKPSKLREQVGVSGIPIYVLDIGDSGSGFQETSLGVMDELVKLAGGGLFMRGSYYPFRVNTVKFLEEDISFIARDIRYQYTLGFNLVPSKDKWHRVKVKVNLPPETSKEQKRIYVRSREKYYAAPNSP